MNNNEIITTSRRKFLANTLPACAAICIGCSSSVFAETAGFIQDKHKFESEMEQIPTYKRWIQQRHNKYISILKHLEGFIGKNELHEMLKKASYNDNVELGKRLSNKIDSLNTFAVPFRNEKSGVGRTIDREIVQDNDKVFEMKITKCLTEIVFREAGATDLGYACVCYADFGLPLGINPKLKLIRTKTLMEGHDCCNHKYIWED